MPAANRSRSERPAILLAGAAIVAGGLLAYAGSFAGVMLYDDLASIAQNPAIRHLWPWGAAGASAGGLTVSGRPVLQVSLALNQALGGDGVWGYHAANLAIHLLAGLVLFGLARRTLARGGAAADRASSLAGAIALLWTVHPLQTEAVTYIVQRAESLMGLCYLLTLYSFVRGIESGGAARLRSPVGELRRGSEAGGREPLGWFLVSVAACLLGMATKEVMVTAPVLVLLYDRTFVAGTFAEAWRRRRGYYAGLAATWLALAALVASTGGNRGGTAGFGAAVSAWDYGLTQFVAVAHYLRLAVWPHPLVFEYGTFWIRRTGEVLPPALLVLLLLAATLWGLSRPAEGHRGARAAGFLGAWFFGILAPTSLVPGIMQMIVEHRMYLPLAAGLAAIVLGADALAARLGLAPAVRLALLLAAALACGGLTWRRNELYRSAIGLWGDTVAKRPDNAVAVYNLGVALDQTGRLPEAAGQFVRAAQLRPDLAAPRYDLGFALYQMGRLEEAVAQYQEALRIDPRSPLTRNSLGVALAALGRPLEATGQYAEALRLKPDYAQAQDNWGNALLQLGEVPEAAAHYGEAVRLDPASAVAHFNLANALLRLGRPGEAQAQFALAQDLAKTSPAR